MSMITQKTGSTFSYAGAFQLPGITPWTDASADLRDREGNLIQHLTVTFTPPVSPNTLYTMQLYASDVQTKTWPLTQSNKEHVLDVLFKGGIYTQHTNTVLVKVVKGQTE